ncbi:hypothetical protein D3C86_1405630 [compost metagenome]
MHGLVGQLQVLVHHRIKLGVLLGELGVGAQHRAEVIAVPEEQPVDDELDPVAHRHEGHGDHDGSEDIPGGRPRRSEEQFDASANQRDSEEVDAGQGRDNGGVDHCPLDDQVDVEHLMLDDRVGDRQREDQEAKQRKVDQQVGGRCALPCDKRYDVDKNAWKIGSRRSKEGRLGLKSAKSRSGLERCEDDAPQQPKQSDDGPEPPEVEYP